MVLALKLTDARQAEVTGEATISVKVTMTDGTQQTSSFQHIAPAPFTIPLGASWSSVTISISHPDYVDNSIVIRLGGGPSIEWDDPATQLSTQGGDQVLTIPLSRVQHAPGEIPPFGAPSGAEHGVYIQQKPGTHQEPGTTQEYVTLSFHLGTVNRLYTLADLAGAGTDGAPTCLLNPHDDDGWKRFNVVQSQDVQLRQKGGFVWLEYGSMTSARPREPRFLIALWAPAPQDVINNGAVDVLVFFSPSTATTPYQVSTFPFRDRYPYSALTAQAIDPETGEVLQAKVQPYVRLGYKYLFRPSFFAQQSVASNKPLLIVMPIFPNVEPKQAEQHMWQPFKSKAGLYRLLLEVVLFLHREGYGSSAFSFTSRWNGSVAPIAGAKPPERPSRFATTNRPVLTIRSVVVAAFSSGIGGAFPIFKNDALTASATDYPASLFGADPGQFDRCWQEFWDLDLVLDPSKSGVTRSDYEMTMKSWLVRDTRRLCFYHSGWTTGQSDPDRLFPQFRALLGKQPTVRRDAAVPARWGADWRDPAAHWLALFLSGALLRAHYVDSDVSPDFPLGDPAGSKGSPPGAVHPFAAELGFGHASRLRNT